MRNGRLAATLDASEATEEAVMHAAATDAPTSVASQI